MGKSKRKIIKIDDSKCTGCGLCVPSCKEGALKIVDGKAKLVSDVYCDGLGACLGDCPFGALTIEEREADEFDESKVNKHIQSQDTHLSGERLPCGCPGEVARSINRDVEKNDVDTDYLKIRSELSQWPVKLALIPIGAPYLNGADLTILADCTAVAYANLHRDFIKGRVVAIACPKLDDTEPYVEKLTQIIKMSQLKSIEVVMMEVPCCAGLFDVAMKAKERAGVELRIKKTIVGLEGNIVNN